MPGIDRNFAVVARGDACGGEVEVGGVGAPSQRPEEEIGGEGFAVIERDDALRAVPDNTGNLCAAMDADALRPHRLGQRFGDVRVMRAQEAFAADDDVAGGAERLQDTGDFAGDVAATNDNRALRLAFEGEEIVRSFTERRAFDMIGNGRLAAGSDDDMWRAVQRVADAHGVGALKAGEAANERHPAFAEVGFVDAVQAGDVGVARFLEGVPAEGHFFRHVCEEARRITQSFGGVRRVPEQFFRHAADVHTRPAEAAAFDDGDFRAIFGGAARGGNAAGTAANTNEVKGLHVLSCCKRAQL